MQNELKIARNWLQQNTSITVAVVEETWGSAPRGPGSLMIINTDGRFEGSVSGGCVEGSVIAEAQASAAGQTYKQLNFTVSTEDAWQVGLACGGRITIGLFKLTPESLPALDAALSVPVSRDGGTFTLPKTKGHATFCSRKTTEKLDSSANKLELAITPPYRMVITGAVHIAQALAPMAKACGFDVTVIDPRGIFTDERHFEGASIINDWPDEVLKNSTPDKETAIVTLTHDPKIDDAALKCALASDAFYVGSLGSKKTHASRLKRLAGEGFSEAEMARIHGPIGLDIGSKTPAEIAISIIAEIISARPR
jgi:xanthine dehydrogenase accessory factor